MAYPVPGEVLRALREREKKSQTVLAKVMGTVPSVLSKLEKLDEVEPEIAERYLAAVGSPVAQEALAHYQRDWRRSAPPSYLHPDREVLWAIDQAGRTLDEFQVTREDDILRGPIDLLRNDLRVAENYLDRRDHVVAWVGDIGVGKTTALSHALGLLVGDGRSGRRPAFPVGAGRVTVCETAIRYSPNFGVLVDAMEEEEVVRLVQDLVASLAPGAAGVGVPGEIARMIRTMSDMRLTNRIEGEDVVQVDPILERLAEGHGAVEVADRMIAAMNLADRRERQVILQEGAEDGLSWVHKLVSAINSGAEPRFSIPRRITVLMPSARLNADGQVLSVVDTRGVEGVTQRSDITLHAEDPRALLVLCTKFADAPNATVQRHLQESQDAASDAAERHRQCILVLPRGGEALEAPGHGGAVSTRQEGYAYRKTEVRQALVSAGLPQPPTYFFDAHQDDPDKIWRELRDQVKRMRDDYAERGLMAAEGVRHLIENVDDVLATQARRDVEIELGRLLESIAPLPASVRPPHQNLIDQLGVGHHSSIAASIYRRGDWENFQFDHILGLGVRIDANLRSWRAIQKVEDRLEDLATKHQEVEGIGRMLRALRSRLGEGRQEFLGAARMIGRDAYGQLLASSDIWQEVAGRYGQGAGYKRDVAETWREWFEENEEAQGVGEEITARLQDAWDAWVIEPMRLSIRSGGEVGE